MTDAMEILRKLLDPTTWPKDWFVLDGEVYAFESDDPNEECIRRVLFYRFQ
jgi:hypothetical protein